MLVTQSYPNLWDLMGCSFSVHQILQVGILEWVAIPFSRGSSWPRVQTQVSCIAGRFFAVWATSEVKSLNRVWLCDPTDCTLPGSSVHGIFQAIVLEWIAISFSRGSSWPRDRTQVSCIVDRRFTIWATREVLEPPGKLLKIEIKLSEVNKIINIYCIKNIMKMFKIKNIMKTYCSKVRPKWKHN